MPKRFKKASIRLTHPRLKVVVEQTIQGAITKEMAIQQLKWKYGKKFYECKLEYITYKTYIINLETKELYCGYNEAVQKTGFSKAVILRHLRGDYKIKKSKLAWAPCEHDITKQYGK